MDSRLRGNDVVEEAGQESTENRRYQASPLTRRYAATPPPKGKVKVC